MGLMTVGFEGRFLRELVLRLFGFSGANSGSSGSADGIGAARGGGGASPRGGTVSWSKSSSPNSSKSLR
jgi:hypothetical protein